MRELIDPTTGRTLRHAQWLEMLMTLTQDRRLLEVAFEHGVSPQNALHLATMIQSHRERKPLGCQCDGTRHQVKPPITDEQLAMGLQLFLADRIVRRATADHMQREWDTAGDDVMAKLLELKEETAALVSKGERRLESGLVVMGS